MPAASNLSIRQQPHQAPAAWMTGVMDSQERAAEPGELCTCGRQAGTVFSTDRFGEVGHCSIDGAAFRPVLPCPWCGNSEPHLESRGDPARCPHYTLRAPAVGA